MRRPLVAALAVIALALTACGSEPKSSAARQGTITVPGSAGSTQPQGTTETRPDHPVFTVATAQVSRVAVFDAAGADVPVRTLANPNPVYNTPRVFLVKEDRGGWMEVYLPIRPNGSTGWIKRTDVSVDTHSWRIVVELGAHRLTAYDRNEVFLQEPVAVGHEATPTPGGLFYTTELIEVLPFQRGAYGPYAYGLSGYSEVLYDFGGGDGQFGIHGTGDPSSVGRDVSNGCIRLTNDAITKLAMTLPIGVPVEIQA